MTRISTTAANQQTISNFLRNQVDLVKLQEQLSSGYKAQDLKGEASYAGLLNSLKSVLARSQGTSDRIDQVQPRLDFQATSFTQITTNGDAIRDDILNALSLDDGRNFLDQVGSALSSIGVALNQQYDDQYIFAGVTSNKQPFNVQTLADLAALPAAADAFDNANLKTVSRIDDGKPVETGFLASEVAQGLVGIIKDIKDFNDGPNGPFGQDLTDVQRTFLRTTLQNLDPVLDKLRELEGKNGLLQNRVDAAKTFEQDRQTTLSGLVGNLQDADMGKVATRLQQTQSAVEISAKAFSVLSTTSLLPYL